VEMEGGPVLGRVAVGQSDGWSVNRYVLPLHGDRPVTGAMD